MGNNNFSIKINKMADFQLFWPVLVHDEGYYANKPNDSGGETWIGISRNNYPNLTLWHIIDSYKGRPDFPSVLRTDASLKASVIYFYQNTEWHSIDGDQINNQSIANFIADWGVNAGMSVPIKHAQAILGVNIDGKIGLQTVTAINNADGASFYQQMKQARIKFYNDVILAHPEDRPFLNDWIDRTNYVQYQP